MVGGPFVKHRYSLCGQTSRPARSRVGGRRGFDGGPGLGPRVVDGVEGFCCLDNRGVDVGEGSILWLQCLSCASEPSALANFAVGSLAIKPHATVVRESCACCYAQSHAESAVWLQAPTPYTTEVKVLTDTIPGRIAGSAAVVPCVKSNAAD